MHQPTPQPGPARLSYWTLAVSALALAAALAWQAWVVPPLARGLQPWLGDASGTLLAALAVLLGSLGLGLALRRTPAAAGTDALPLRTARAASWERFEYQLLALAHAMPIGVLVLDGERIVGANPAARSQLRRNAAQLQETPPARLFVDPSMAQLSLHGALPLHASVQLYRVDGEVFRAELRAHDLNLDHRHLRVLLFDDRTERDLLDARLRAQNEQLHALTGRLITAQEDERRTLSRELHDDIGQAITAIKLGAVALSDSDPARQEIVDEIVAIADQTVVKLRDLSMLLRPPQLDALGLEAAVRWQAQALFRGGQPCLRLDFTPLPRRPLPAVELACFRIVQEALTNVLRYSGATAVQVAVAADGEDLELSVNDDGRGFVAGEASGLGLVTMRERAQQVGGWLRIDSTPGGGTTVRARLPMGAAPTTRD